MKEPPEDKKKKKVKEDQDADKDNEDIVERKEKAGRDYYVGDEEVL